jgi:hypothetical protein
LVSPDLFFDSETYGFLVVVEEVLAVGVWQVPDEELVWVETWWCVSGCGERGGRGGGMEKGEDGRGRVTILSLQASR